MLSEYSIKVNGSTCLRKLIKVNGLTCLRKLIVQVIVVLRKTVGCSQVLTLKMTAAKAVKMSVTSTNSLSQDYTNLNTVPDCLSPTLTNCHLSFK